MDDLIVKQYQPKKRDEEAKVTRKLKNLNMKKLLILILVLLTAIPLLDASVYFPEDATIENKAIAINLQLKVNPAEKIVEHLIYDFE